MSWDLDFVVVANIVKFNKPNKILELGAGDAESRAVTARVLAAGRHESLPPAVDE